MIQRRTLLKAGTAITLGAPALIAHGQQAVTLRFHTFMPPTSNIWSLMLKPWMEKVEKDSGGRIKIEGYPSMQMGGTPPQLYDQARDGVADIVWTLPGYTSGRFVRAEVFELPFTMTEAVATSRAYWEFIQTHAPDEFRETKVLALHVHGRGVFHSADKLIQSPEDLRGMKVRGPTRQVTNLLSAFGATPVPLPLPAVPEALSKGVITALATPWDVVPSIRVQEMAKYHSEFPSTSPALYTGTFVMAMNRAKYDSLPPDLKRVIDANSGMETSALFGKTTQDSDAIGLKSAKDRGNTIHTISAEETKRFIELSSKIDQAWVADLNRRGHDGAKLLEAAKSLIAKYSKTT